MDPFGIRHRPATAPRQGAAHVPAQDARTLRPRWDIKRRGGFTGAFTWRHRYTYDQHPMKLLDAELERQGENFGLLRAGLLEGSLEALRDTKTSYDEFIAR